MTPEQRRQYRAIGGRLALYVRQQQSGLPPVSTLLAVAADLAGEQGQLVLPLRELVSRPSFPSLAAKAGSGSGSLERQALLQSMEATFAPALIAALGEILSGFLDLPAGPTPSQNTSQPSQKPVTAKFPPGNPTPNYTVHTEISSANQDPAQLSRLQNDSSLPARSRFIRMVAIAATSALLVAGGLSVGGLWLSSRGVSASKLCAAVGLCPSQRGPSTSQQVLESASESSSYHPVIPYGMRYSEARETLLRQGFYPFNPQGVWSSGIYINPDVIHNASRSYIELLLDQARESRSWFYNRNMREVIDCHPQAAQCTTVFLNSAGKEVLLITSSGSERRGEPVVEQVIFADSKGR